MVVGLALTAAGCSTAPARPESVARALASNSSSISQPSTATTIAELPNPVHVRAAGVFGAELRGANDIGPHLYDGGEVSIAGGGREEVGRENNGLVYTCRGGFIDLAHLRDSADLTFFLTTAIEGRLEKGGAIALADQAGVRYLTLRPASPSLLQARGRRELALDIATWAAFEWSVWREIAQWYGYESRPGIPERVLSFAPEDLYSVLLGIQLARGIVLEHPGLDRRGYERQVDAWITAALGQMQIVPRDAARAALASVDGVWWDSRRTAADWKLVRRRNLDLGPELAPWLVSSVQAPGATPFQGCAGPDVPLVLRLQLTPQPADLATVEIEVDENLASHGFPFPREDSSIVTQADFAAILERLRAENSAALGVGADRPDAAKH